jgi:hypothetical protein
MHDPTQARELGIVKKKPSGVHPYAAIEHRVIDSAAYADLTFAARSVLVLLCRQLTRDNNGHLQASFKWMSRFGIKSENTLSQAIKQLIAHGFIYRTRCGGFHRGPSFYSVTWLTIKKKEGLFLDGFQSCAWRYWEPEKNIPPRKMHLASCNKCILPTPTDAVSAGVMPPKTADNELMPVVPVTEVLCHA